jgi:hypothetical protein
MQMHSAERPSRHPPGARRIQSDKPTDTSRAWHPRSHHQRTSINLIRKGTNRIQIQIGIFTGIKAWIIDRRHSESVVAFPADCAPATVPPTWLWSATSPSTWSAKSPISAPSSDAASAPRGILNTCWRFSGRCDVNLDSLPCRTPALQMVLVQRHAPPTGHNHDRQEAQRADSLKGRGAFSAYASEFFDGRCGSNMQRLSHNRQSWDKPIYPGLHLNAWLRLKPDP